MHQQGRKRQRYAGEARQQRAQTLKVYLNAEDRAALRRLAREMGVSDSYAATLAIKHFRANAEAERRDAQSTRAPALALRRNTLPNP